MSWGRAQVQEPMAESEPKTPTGMIPVIDRVVRSTQSAIEPSRAVRARGAPRMARRVKEVDQAISGPIDENRAGMS